MPKELGRQQITKNANRLTVRTIPTVHPASERLRIAAEEFTNEALDEGVFND